MDKTKIKWKKIIEEWGGSGLSVTGYCKSKRLSTSCFYYHRRNLALPLPKVRSLSPKEESSVIPRFVEVVPTPSSPPAITLPKIKITTATGYTMEIFL